MYLWHTETGRLVGRKEGCAAAPPPPPMPVLASEGESETPRVHCFYGTDVEEEREKRRCGGSMTEGSKGMVEQIDCNLQGASSAIPAIRPPPQFPDL